MNKISHRQVKEYYGRLASEYKQLANTTCETVWEELVRKHLSGCSTVMELGCGSSDALLNLNPKVSIGCDLTLKMLLQRSDCRSLKVAGAGEKLPFRNGSFDGIFLVNVLEHVADVDAVLSECSRVLKTGGTWFSITPNGHWKFWLDLAESMRLKIPEGPHSFLEPGLLAKLVGKHLTVDLHKTFLVMPAGPRKFSDWLDRMFCRTIGSGFFQYIVAKK